jgi:hypothetical protein
MNTVNVLYGHSAAGSLQHGLKEGAISGHEVLRVSDELSFGPLKDVRERESFLIHCFTGESDDANLRERVTVGVETWPSRAQYSDRDIVIWHSPNVGEQLMLRMVVYRLTSSRLFEITPPAHGRFRRSTAEYTPDELAAMVTTATELQGGRLAELRADWQRLRLAPEPLRILNAGRIVPVAMEFYDAQILARCAGIPRPAERVIGEVLGNCEQVVSDTFIRFRLFELVTNGRLIADETRGSRREFMVKTAGDNNGNNGPLPGI